MHFQAENRQNRAPEPEVYPDWTSRNMATYKRGKVYWYKFVWNGEQVRASKKTGNHRAAEQIEAAKKTQLAKGEIGIRERAPAPTLADFAENQFIPFVEEQKKDKPRPIDFYKTRVARLQTFPRLRGSKLDAITAADMTAYIAAPLSLSLYVILT